ncbi:isocitrate lyase/PEP mutase family protein [Microbacterium sp.]|uniref:isocitrate lyase/PEP mutase family protein n=1 Tax=Microbacterium sp. TaxID=51671 RepID=UPI0039E2C067
MNERVELFHEMHRGPGFVLPNAWDAGSARLLAAAGFAAIATTSAGIAWACGVADGGGVSREVMLSRIAEIVDAVEVPVTADLEAGYDDVAATVAEAARVGAVGGNIEDSVAGVLLDADAAVERIARARAAAPRGTFVLNARTDAYFVAGSSDPFTETVKRAQRYVDAGADCIFVPGVRDAGTIGRLVREIPAPLNIVAGLTAPVIDAATLIALGVARVSVGGSLARVAYSALDRAARELREHGTLSPLDDALGYADLQRGFTR